MHFNSRPHGGRLKPMLGSYSITNFNSRPHGGRLYPTLIIGLQMHFNSRPHGGRRQRKHPPARRCRISTHALTEGDEKELEDLADIIHFNSRPHGGRRIGSIDQRRITVISTHALTEGDLLFSYISPSLLFQLTPSRRATR